MFAGIWELLDIHSLGRNNIVLLLHGEVVEVRVWARGEIEPSIDKSAGGMLLKKQKLREILEFKLVLVARERISNRRSEVKEKVVDEGLFNNTAHVSKLS